jgi:ElaB/YqjD/DUF883 family membrane-anchored ribosome-binding protein
MDASTPTQTSIVGLVRQLTDDTKRLLRQEVELAKAEISEKVAYFGRNAVALAIGGFVAYAGFIVLLIGLGWLGAWGLQAAGLQPIVASFVGLAGVGVLVVIVGIIFLMKGVKAFSKESLAPQKTIHTIQRLRSSEAPVATHAKAQPEQPKRSSEQMQASVVATEDRMTDAIGELGHRLSPRQINVQVKNRIQEKPYHTGAIAMVTGLISGLLLTKMARRS